MPFREEAGTYAGNPSSWDTKRGLKRTWNGEPVTGSSTQDSAQDRTSKPTSNEKGIVFINNDFLLLYFLFIDKVQLDRKIEFVFFSPMKEINKSLFKINNFYVSKPLCRVSVNNSENNLHYFTPLQASPARTQRRRMRRRLRIREPPPRRSPISPSRATTLS